jgi:hypothetical protein
LWIGAPARDRTSCPRAVGVAPLFPRSKQPHPERGLQHLDALAQRRLAHAERTGGAAERAMLSDGGDVLHLSNVREHGTIIFPGYGNP